MKFPLTHQLARCAPAGAVVLSLLLGGCSAARLVHTPAVPPPPTSTYHIDLYHGSKPVSVQVGDIVVFELATPYGGRWQLLNDPSPILVNRYGGFTFTATAVGSEVVSFASAPGRKAAHNGNFTVRINVLPTELHLRH